MVVYKLADLGVDCCRCVSAWAVTRAAPAFLALLQGLGLEATPPAVPGWLSHYLLWLGKHGGCVGLDLLSDFLFLLFSPSPHLFSAQNEILKSTVSSNDKKTKGRTGWPQHVWALELKQ